MPAVKNEVLKGAQGAKPSVKRECNGSVKQEAPRPNAKAEPGMQVKKEVRVKPEPGLPPLNAKIEQLRQVKAELGGVGGMAALLARGLAIRKENDKKSKKFVKREKGKNGQMKLVKVKKERARNTDGSLRKKTRVTAKRRKASAEVMKREVALSEELADVLGESALSRPETVSRLWHYCKENGMLNPSNRREIQFDEKLGQLMGKSTATMPELIGLLTPHFDYTRSVDEVKKEAKTKLEMKQETKAPKKEMIDGKKSLKSEQTHTSSRKSETRPTLESMFDDLEKAKSETRAKLEPSSQKKAKMEPAEPGVVAQISVEGALCTAVPRVLRFDRTSVLVQCIVSNGCTSFEAVAVPVVGNLSCDHIALRAPCTVAMQESADGFMESFAEARLDKLDPKLPYCITVQATANLLCETDRSCETRLPQRASPGKWTKEEVVVWCIAQQVPELVQKVKDYGMDGMTLLSLAEEDLRQMGVVAPFLLRRLGSSLEALRAGGA